MALLKKLKASTLMETMVATALIVILFMMSSLVLNSLLKNSIKNDSSSIQEHLAELEYKIRNQQLAIPYTAVFKGWDVFVTTQKTKGIPLVVITASKENPKKEIRSYQISE